jgi:RimJ/RimL family protein N-acetyltransferase
MEKLGMSPAGEFDHPRLPESHHYRRHLLYALDQARWRDGARLG